MRKNSILMILYEILVLIIPLITTPYVSRVLGKSGVGIYAYSYSIVSYFVILTQLGVSLYGRREIAKVSHNLKASSRCFWQIFEVEGMMFLISAMVYIGIISYSRGEIKIALLLQSMTLISGLLDISWLYFGLEQFKIAITRNILVKCLSLIFVFTFVKSKEDTYLYVFIMAFSFLLSVLIMWTMLPRYIDFKEIKGTLKEAKKHIKPMFIIFIPVLSSQLYSITDKVLLGVMMDVNQVGIYENAYRLAKVPVSGIAAMGTVMLPRMTHLIAEGKLKQSQSYIDRSLSMTMAFGSAATFGMWGVAKTFTPIFLGSGFEESTLVLRILVILILFIAWGNVFRTQYILPRNMDKIYVKTVTYAAIMNIVLNLVFIPLYGVYGAAFASVLSEGLICIYQTYCIRDEMPMMSYFKKNIKYIISGMIMGIVVEQVGVLLGEQGIFTLVMQIVVGGGIYMCLISIWEMISNQKVVVNEIVYGIRMIMKKGNKYLDR